MLKKLVCVTVVTLVATLMVLPVQAEEVWIPCSDCEENALTTIALPQGETEGIQPLEDHTWGGDPDDDVDGSWLDLIMCLAYWSPDCDVYYHQTIWCD